VNPVAVWCGVAEVRALLKRPRSRYRVFIDHDQLESEIVEHMQVRIKAPLSRAKSVALHGVTSRLPRSSGAGCGGVSRDGAIAALDGLADCGKRWAGRGWANPTEAPSLARNITAIRLAAFRSAPPQEAPIRSENVGAMTRMILYGGVILTGLLMRRWYGGEITIGSFA
jgi:hypothetical protein